MATMKVLASFSLIALAVTSPPAFAANDDSPSIAQAGPDAPPTNPGDSSGQRAKHAHSHHGHKRHKPQGAGTNGQGPQQAPQQEPQ
jgi:hypothetical protein